MEYYYNENIDLNLSEIIIEGDEFKHLIKVLRKSVGDSINITDGKRNIYYSEIVKIEKNFLVCNVVDKKFNLYEPEKKIIVYLAPLRNLNRFEFLIEKIVEVGVFEIVPVITEFTINKNDFNETRYKRFRKIMISAVCQSQRCYLPLIRNAISFDSVLENTSKEMNRVVYYEFSDKNDKFNYCKESDTVSVLIGPEGGFSKNEIMKLKDFNWQFASLGERKFRAETAAILGVYNLLIN